jgi:molybdate transport system substrate-binding protein
MKHARSHLSAGLTVLLGLLLACTRAEAPEGTIRVAAAADLRAALPEVIAAFEGENAGTTVTVVYGSSGNFHAQLLHRAPFDVFLSADARYAESLIEAGRASEASLFRYAEGRIALLLSKHEPPEDGDPLSVLADPALRHVSIANPEHAPYGRAAIEALTHAGILEAVRPRLVFGENAAHAVQLVHAGAAEAGVVALPLLVGGSAPRGRFVPIPPTAHAPLDQAGIILDQATDPEAAWRFRAFLVGEDAQAILERHGFGPPIVPAEARAGAD